MIGVYTLNQLSQIELLQNNEESSTLFQHLSEIFIQLFINVLAKVNFRSP